MKNHLLFCLLTCCLYVLEAQIVNIPDANFKNVLVNSPCAKTVNGIWVDADIDNDGEIQISEAEMFVDLNIGANNIVSLVGIETFTNLTNLNCYGNPINSIDVSALTNLQYLNCFQNQLTSLDISTLTNLMDLDCSYNQIVNINITNNPNLYSLICNNNPLLSSLNMNGCANLVVLNCNACSLSILNLTYTTNLNSLSCNSNQLQNLDVTPLTNLTYLACNNNLLTTLDVSPLLLLNSLYCSSNQLSLLDVSPLTSLQILHCDSNLLTNLDVTGLLNLNHINCGNNQISTLNVNNLLNLQYLSCYDNLLSSLDVSALTGLSGFMCNKNQIQSLLLPPWWNVASLNCSYNQLTSLNLGNSPNIFAIICGHNQIQNLDVSNFTGLYNLLCENNLLTSLDVSGLTNLNNLNCNANLLASLDVSDLIELTYLHCDSNQITTLLAKNGRNELLNFSNNPLQYICIDAGQLVATQQKIAQYGMTNVVVGSFCSFAPGGNNYNTVAGTSRYDEDMNGCSIGDSAYSYMMIKSVNAVDTSYFYTNIQGYYNAIVDTFNYTFSPQLQNLSYFSVNPATVTVHFPNNNNNTQIENFCFAPNGIFPDVEIVLSPQTNARPGFNAIYQLLFHNKGTTTVSGDIALDFMGNKMTFVSASVPPLSQNATQLTWNYSNLQPFEIRIITFVMNLLPPAINNAGDEIGFTGYIALVNDASPNDNHSDLKQVVVNSYDPNDKTCLEGNEVLNTQIGEYLHYKIRFQNTGTLYAEKVVIIDSIDVNKFDISSLQVMDMSHLGQVRITGNVVEFYFDQIMLPDSFTNEPLSHGYILFKIKTKSSLPFNSVVKNKAEIYFDYNFPVITNTAITTFSNTTSVTSALPESSIKCYPNPAENSLTVETTKPTNCLIINILGEELIKQTIFGKQVIDISSLPQGLYWIKTQSSTKGHRFVKE